MFRDSITYRQQCLTTEFGRNEWKLKSKMGKLTHSRGGKFTEKSNISKASTVENEVLKFLYGRTKND